MGAKQNMPSPQFLNGERGSGRSGRSSSVLILPPKHLSSPSLATSQHPQNPALVQALAPSVWFRAVTLCLHLAHPHLFSVQQEGDPWQCKNHSWLLSTQSRPLCQPGHYYLVKLTLPPHAFHLSSDIMSWTHLYFMLLSIWHACPLPCLIHLSRFLSSGFPVTILPRGSYLLCRNSF